MCVWFTACVCLYSVCASTPDVRAAKTEVKKWFSMFGCVILFLCELVYVRARVCVCVLLSLFVCTVSVRQPLMFARQKLGKITDFQCSVVWYCFCVSVFMCVCVISVCVCLYGVCASTTDVRAPKTEVKFRFSMFGCIILFCVSLFMCVCVCICVCVCVRASVFVARCLCGSLFICVCLCLFRFDFCLWQPVPCTFFCLISASNLTYHLYYLFSLLFPFCSSPHLFSVHQLNHDQYVHNCSFMYYFY